LAANRIVMNFIKNHYCVGGAVSFYNKKECAGHTCYSVNEVSHFLGLFLISLSDSLGPSIAIEPLCSL